MSVDAAFEDNASGVSAGNMASLRAGGPLAQDPSFRFLYSYDATVFPRGQQPPRVQLAGDSVSALRIDVTSKHLHYEAFLGASSPVRAAFSNDRKKYITESASASDRVSVSVTKLANGVSLRTRRPT